MCPFMGRREFVENPFYLVGTTVRRAIVITPVSMLGKNFNLGYIF
jgi:hypothetical protein